jgi:hypothetical protein
MLLSKSFEDQADLTGRSISGSPAFALKQSTIYGHNVVALMGIEPCASEAAAGMTATARRRRSIAGSGLLATALRVPQKCLLVLMEVVSDAFEISARSNMRSLRIMVD